MMDLEARPRVSHSLGSYIDYSKDKQVGVKYSIVLYSKEKQVGVQDICLHIFILTP